jgi:hypothetical protein
MFIATGQDGYAEVEAKPKKVKPQQPRKPISKKSEELAHAYAGETFTVRFSHVACSVVLMPRVEIYYFTLAG